MTVSITASPLLGGVAFADSLQGGGTGYQFGTSEAGVLPSTKNIYIRHDGASDITNLAVYAKPYSQTYGGEYSASSDHTKLVEQGNAGSGFEIDFDWDGIAFAVSTKLSGSIGSSPTNAIEMPQASMIYNSGGSPVAPTTPVSGVMGTTGNTVKGDSALLKCRWNVPSGELQPGRRQIDLAFIYNFTT